MPRYYCDYCDTYLTHDSPSVRKQHNAGYKHKANVRTYYQQFEAQLNQHLIDQKVKEHIGQAGAYPPVGVAYNQLRPRLPILPTPVMPIGGNPQVPLNSQLVAGIRPPVFPRPLPGGPGYMPQAMPPMVAPPGAASVPGQVNGLSRPMTAYTPAVTLGSTSTPTSSSVPSMFMPSMYQANPNPSAAPTAGAFDSSNTAAQVPESNNH